MLRGDSLAGAITATITYFDIFAFAATPGEIHRFLVGWRASRSEVEDALRSDTLLHKVLDHRDGYWFLRGKDHLAPRRARFSHRASSLWIRARHMARVVERSGLARCGMVTGSLATDNTDEHADVDFLFIYPTARTWSSYAALRLLAKLPALGLRGMCPNYVLPDDRLEIQPQNLFTAWEIAKAVPMFGFSVYRELLEANRWVLRFLPNSLPLIATCSNANARGVAAADPAVVVAITELALFRRLEAFEKQRKSRADVRDVGVDLQLRAKQGSSDRHSPTRSLHVLSELRYRWSTFGLEEHPLFPEIRDATLLLGQEMHVWGAQGLSPRRNPSTLELGSRATN